MRLAQFFLEVGSPFVVNPARVVYIMESSEGCTEIYFTTGTSVDVQGSVAHVQDALEGKV